MLKDILTMEVEKALEATGCPMCAFIANSVNRYVRSLLHEYVNDPGLREELSRSRGFCREHAWLVQKIESVEWHDGLGTALLHEQILGELLDDLDGVSAKLSSLSRRQARWRAIWRRVPGLYRLFKKRSDAVGQHNVSGACPVCRIADQSADIFAFGLLENLSDPEFRRRYQASEGLCVPHLTQILRKDEFSKGRLDTLLNLEKAKIDALLGELGEYIRKHDYRFAGEPKGNEQTSWIRAVRKAVGNESGH